MTNGNIKCKLKILTKVKLLIENPPQSHSTRILPAKGTAVNKFVTTVAAQKLICPHGSTYPVNAVAINKKNNSTPTNHVSRRYPKYDW
jgi:hypothetical protein